MLTESRKERKPGPDQYTNNILIHIYMIHTHTPIYIHTSMHIHIQIYMPSYTYIYIHTYLYTTHFSYWLLFI